MTVREQIQERLAKMNDADLSRLLERLDRFVQGASLRPSPNLVKMVQDIQANNAAADPKRLDNLINNAVQDARHL